MFYAFRTTLILLIILLVTACSSTPLTPSQVAQHFWAAVLVDDNETANRYVSSSSIQEVKSLPEGLHDATVSFGKVRMKSDQAAIETVLQFERSEDDRNANFVTYLQREASQWRVDLMETKKSLDNSLHKRGLDKLVDDLRKLGKDFTTQIDEARQNWEQAQPEIKKDLEELGKSVQEEVEGAIEKFGPEIERNVEDLQKSIDEALKELEKGLPEKKEAPQVEPEGRMI